MTIGTRLLADSSEDKGTECYGERSKIGYGSGSD